MIKAEQPVTLTHSEVPVMNQTMLAAIAESAQTPLVVRHIARHRCS